MASYNWDLWLRGIISAAIGGAAGAIGASLAIVNETGQLPSVKSVGIAVLVGAIMTMAAYLKESPLPPEEG